MPGMLYYRYIFIPDNTKSAHNTVQCFGIFPKLYID